jgi:hypothetical protein
MTEVRLRKKERKKFNVVLANENETGESRAEK